MTDSAHAPSLGDAARLAATRAELLARVRATVLAAARLDRAPDTLDPDAPLFGTGLGLDSIDAVELVVALDRQFDTDLASDAFGRAEMRTCNGLVDLVLARRAPGALHGR